jgi:hypothetical protein
MNYFLIFIYKILKFQIYFFNFFELTCNQPYNQAEFNKMVGSNETLTIRTLLFIQNASIVSGMCKLLPN